MISLSLMSRRWAAVTTNVNGWHRKPPDKTEMRKVLLIRMLRQHHVDVAAVQEHHITMQPVLDSQKLWAEKRRYGLAAVPTPTNMRGGVLLMWRTPVWELQSAYIGHRLIVAVLRHVSGDSIQVLAGHLHHDAPQRQKQWEQLGRRLSPAGAPLIALCDHKSHIIPGVDSEGMKESKLKTQLNDKARQQEVQILEKCKLHHAWDVLYGECDERPNGFTYGWVQKPGVKWKPRRLDRVHVADSLREYIQAVYTTTAVASDHKAVVVQFEQPLLRKVQPRQRFPTEMLSDQSAVDNLRGLLQGLQAPDSQNILHWWDNAGAMIQEQGVLWRRMNPREDYLPIQGILRLSSPGRVVPARWEYLADKGVCPETSAQAYQLLLVYADQDVKDSQKRTLCHMLKDELLSKQHEAAAQAERRRKVHVQLRELQAKRQLYGIKNKRGVYCTLPRDIATAFQEFW